MTQRVHTILEDLLAKGECLCPIRSRVGVLLDRVGIALCLGSILSLAGCANDPSPTFTPDATVAELEPTVPVELPAPPVLTSTGERLATQYVWLTLPLDAEMGDAWSLLATDGLAGTTLNALALNGIRAGILPADDWQAFQAALPPATDASSPQQALLSDHPLAIWKSPPLTGTVAVLPPDTSPLPTTYHSGGRLQLLLRLTRLTGGRYLDLIPHHHLTQPLPYEVVNGELRLRTPLERELDGTLFHRLTLRAQAPQGGYLIVGLQSVRSTARDAQDSDGGSAANADVEDETRDGSEPVFEERDASEATPLLPLLGTAIFTGRAFGEDVQRVLIIPLGP